MLRMVLGHQTPMVVYSLSSAGVAIQRQHGGKPAGYAPELEENACDPEQTLRR